jgi:hypothetical protein
LTTDLNLGYVGGSGGFLALHLLLLSNNYNCCIDGSSVDEIIDHQWNITDPNLWKSNELWPNNEKTKVNFSNNRLFFHCQSDPDKWKSIVDRKVFVYTDLKLHLALSKYKNAWIYHASANRESLTLDYWFKKFYDNIKDPAWPQCNTISQISQLPKKIQQELENYPDFCLLTSSRNWDDWFLLQHQHSKLNNQVVYSNCVLLAQCSDIVVDLKDIVRSHGAALLTPLNLTVSNQHRMLINRWLSLHPGDIVKQLIDT